jgi:two-component system nitrogen regulation sensor histidine kinase GlnL
MTVSAESALPLRSVSTPEAVLNALPHPVLVLDPEQRIRFANLAAENFFGFSSSSLAGRPLDELLSSDNPIFSLMERARSASASVSGYGVTLETRGGDSHFVSVDIAPLAEDPVLLAVCLQERSIARRIDHLLTHRGAARSVSAMAAMLAHEVKNPLSGIRGAAQLLEQDASADDRVLTQLICQETDRIVGLVDRMDMFSDSRPIAREAVNIHRVLDHVRRVAESGFAQHVRFSQRYDPSLPPVLGNRDLLIQALMNLVKNAAEAVPSGSGVICFSTRYQQGVRLVVPGSSDPVHLPLLVSIADNGPGIPDDLREHLFEPFVTTKANGSGLGLALVAKIIGDLGGAVELESRRGRTEFRLMLPMDLGGSAERADELP